MSKRDLRLDFLRGFALCAMIVDHLGCTSWLHAITGGDRFFVSGAEAFLFISGLLVGIVHGGTARTISLAVATKRILKRAWELYLLAVTLALIFLILDSARVITLENGLQLFIAALTLQRTYPIVDILPLYALLMLAAPLALLLLKMGHARILLAGSVLLWMAYQLFPAELSQVPWVTDNWFKFAAWQIIFFVAMATGYHRDAIAKSLNRFVNYQYLVMSAMLFFGLIALYLLGFSLPSSNPSLDVATLTKGSMGKVNVGPGRLLALLIALPFAALVTTLVWKPIKEGLGWLFIPLGQNALYGFTVHTIFVRAFDLFTSRAAQGYTANEVAINTVTQLAAIAMIWLMIRNHLFFGMISSLKLGFSHNPISHSRGVIRIGPRRT